MGLVIPFEIGQVFTNNRGDSAKIIKLIGGSKYKSRKAKIRFEDGTVTEVATSKLNSGSWKNPNKPVVCGVGFIGQGKYNKKHKDGLSRAYTKWNSMLRRCYNEGDKGWENYGKVGVTVCKEWHNFQNFAEWFYRHDYSSRELSLDKDIKYPYGFTGNLYCPDYCCLVSMRINNKMMGIGTLTVMKRREEVSNWVILDNGISIYSSFDENLIKFMLSEVRLKKLLEIRRDIERCDRVEEGTIKAIDVKIYNYTKDVVMEDKKLFLEHIRSKIESN